MKKVPSTYVNTSLQFANDALEETLVDPIPKEELKAENFVAESFSTTDSSVAGFSKIVVPPGLSRLMPLIPPPEPDSKTTQRKPNAPVYSKMKSAEAGRGA